MNKKNNRVAITAGVLMIVLNCFSSVAQTGEKNKDAANKSDLKAIGISLDSVDYTDLNFLTETLKDKRIVMLGEFTHGAKEINMMKIRLMKFLHEKMGYKVLVIESDLAAMAAMNAQKSSNISYSDLIYQGWPVIWYTQEYKEFMKYLKNENNLELAGVDPQLTTHNTRYYLRRLFRKVDTVAANTIYKAEEASALFFSQLKDSLFTHSPDFQKKLDSCLNNYKEFKNLISKYKDDLVKAGTPVSTIDFLYKSVENRTIRLKYMAANSDNDAVRFRIRDSIMAKNLEWIAETMYPNEKIIVSAHNYHISKCGDELPVMGSMLPAAIKKQSYVIGFYGINGMYGDNSGNPVSFTAPAANSLRNYLSGMKNAGSFIPLNKLSNKKNWVNQQVQVDGFVNISGGQNMVLSKNFDAVIVIKDITVPAYLYK